MYISRSGEPGNEASHILLFLLMPVLVLLLEVNHCHFDIESFKDSRSLRMG